MFPNSLQIMDHINAATENGRHRSPDPGVPQVTLSYLVIFRSVC